MDEIKADRIGVQLVNTNQDESRTIILHAGPFGEHSFRDVSFNETRQPVGEKDFKVELAAASSIRLSIGLDRFVSAPTYAFPWHGYSIPVPFR